MSFTIRSPSPARTSPTHACPAAKGDRLRQWLKIQEGSSQGQHVFQKHGRRRGCTPIAAEEAARSAKVTSREEA